MEEETLLLNNDSNLPLEDAQKYFEAFKEFDPKNSGQVSLRELHLVFRRWLVSKGDIRTFMYFTAVV